MPTPQVIDLSHHNTVPKYLHDAAAAGIVGVIHKATEGVTHTDAKCAARLALARDAGMCWGLYHFLRPGNIQKQADFFLSKTDLYDENTLLALDFEVDGISADDLLTWLERVESKTGQKPVLYSGSFLKALKGQERLGGYRLWLAQYGSHAVLPKGFHDYFLWQYSEHGQVPGVTGTCDVNTSKMTNEELRQNWIDSASLSAKQDSPSDTNIVQQTPADEGTPIVQKADTIVNTGDTPAPAPLPQTNPVTVKPEQMSLTSKLVSLGVAITAVVTWIKSILGDAYDSMVGAINPKFLLGTVVSAGLVILAIWIYNKSAQRANDRTLKLMDAAADPAKNNVELKG